MVASQDRRFKRALLVFAVTFLVLGVELSLPSARAAGREMNCYVIADDGDLGEPTDGGAEDLLTLVDTEDTNPATNETNVGTGTESFGVEALAFRPGTTTLYGADEGQLGILDLTTGLFAPRPNPIGSGNGAAGTVTFNNIDGISFHPGTEVLYGVQRERSEPPDLLLQINPETGERVANAFGAGVDYVVVDAIGNLANIDDIAFTPDGIMYGIANDEGNDDVLVTINPATGDPTVVGVVGVDDMEGLTSTPDGALLGTTGKNGAIPDTLWDIDRATGTASNPRRLDNGADKEALACHAKRFDVKISVEPKKDVNEVNDPHTFEVRLTRIDDEGTGGFGGETVHLVLSQGTTDAHFTEINGEPASGTEADCVTTSDDPSTSSDEGGFCFVTITSSQAGTATLTATWEGKVGAETVTRSDSGQKIYVKVTIDKSFTCPPETPKEIPRGGVVDYTITFMIEGSRLSDVKVVDDLPPEVVFVSASPIAGVTPTTPPPDTPNGTVTWSFLTLEPGTYTGTIRVRVVEDVSVAGDVTNTVTLTAKEITPKTDTATFTILDAGREGGSRAFGASLDLFGATVIAPTPDSDTTNPGELLSVPDLVGGSTTPLITLLSVSESDDSTGDQEAHSATATAVGVDLNVPGVVHLQASTVVAKSSSHASATGAGSSRGGSLIQNLIINDHEYGNVSQPTTINVLDPLTGDVLAEVHLLETTRSGAAAGEAQPNGANLFASGIAVNGIHVKVHLLDLADLIVSHADSTASFPSGLACGEGIPAVSGSAYSLGVNLKPDSEGGIDLGTVKVTEVKLPITGGVDEEHLLNLDIPGVVLANAAGARTEGEITDGDDEDTVPVEATSEAHIAEADVLDGTITATLIRATSHSEVGATPVGSTTIAHLEIGGTDVCQALGLDSVCMPEPNTVLLIPGGPVLVVLNEQIEEPGGLTVNAVHIWVLGKDNPFGLPIGADVVIANAHSDAHPAGEIVVDDGAATINVKALSAPSAKRLAKEVGRPTRYELPVVTAPRIRAPEVSVPAILRDPVSVLEDLTELPLAEDVLADATKLVETLTDPEALLEALADPATLLEGLTDPAAAIAALADVTGVADEAATEGSVEEPATTEELVVRLRRLAGLE